jgi:hypothetical protein
MIPSVYNLEEDFRELAEGDDMRALNFACLTVQSLLLTLASLEKAMVVAGAWHGVLPDRSLPALALEFARTTFDQRATRREAQGGAGKGAISHPTASITKQSRKVHQRRQNWR